MSSHQIRNILSNFEVKVWSIQNDAALPLPSMDDLSYNIAPYLERAGSQVADQLPSPRTLSVHTTFGLTPAHPKSRYIYVARNARDACVSYYHFCRDSVGGKEYKGASFDEFFEEFVRGDVPYGDYFDHVKDWWQHRNDPNVYFTTYEAMQSDPRKAVLDVARFISDEKNDFASRLLQDDEKILNGIVKNTSFTHMKKSIPVVIKRATDDSCGDSLLDAGVKVDFFRKGIVGDWVNYFSEHQVSRLNERQAGKFSGSGIEGL